MDSPRYGRYQTVKLLGSGGMGAVYLARDELLGRDVAIKTIRSMPMAGIAGEMFRARFMNEARAIASLAHANIVRVFDLGFEGDTPYLVMEVITGASLKDRVEQRGRLTPIEARALGVQIARALQTAHAAGILHRDVKPANVLEAEDGVWKLADFGVAHVPDSSLTMSGQFLGSPAYAAPEAIERGESGPAMDVFGVGATLYEALTGEPPYGRGGLISVAVLASKGDPRPVTELNPGVPPELAASIMTALARDPARRPSAGGLAEQLASASIVDALGATAISTARPAPILVPVAHARSWRPGRTAVVAGLAVAMLAIGVAIGTGNQTRDPRTAAPFEGLPGSSASVWNAAPDPQPYRDGKQEERWRKVQEKLDRGDLKGAEKELERILDRSPDDSEARDLLERVRASREHGPGRRGEDD
jgi:serine/threonine-protein kinase